MRYLKVNLRFLERKIFMKLIDFFKLNVSSVCSVGAALLHPITYFPRPNKISIS